MVAIRKRKIGNEYFFYLEHSLRIKGKVEKREKYLGKTVPNNIEKIKQKFFHDLFKEKWSLQFDKIKKKFSAEYKKFPKTAKTKYIEYFMVKFTYDTNRIEGSTLTLKDTANLLKDGISPNNKPIKDVKEAEAHKKVFYTMLNHTKDLNLNTVLHWHKLLLQNVDKEIAGKIRKHQVKIAGANIEFPFPAELNILLREFFKWYHKVKNKLHPIELAALAHLKFVSIHPFTDGNGRISRLIMNSVLKNQGYPMLNIHYSNRVAYYTALERSQKTKKGYIFIQYISKRYFKEYYHCTK